MMVFTRIMTRVVMMKLRIGYRKLMVNLITSIIRDKTNKIMMTYSNSTQEKRLRILNVYLTCSTKKSQDLLILSIYKQFLNVLVEILKSQKNYFKVLIQDKTSYRSLSS